VTPEEIARVTGRDRGWRHADFVAAYGTESDHGRPLEAIIDAMRPGGQATDSERAAFAAGFAEGMAEWEQEQELPDDDEADES
jgi:hypothetical protein